MLMSGACPAIPSLEKMGLPGPPRLLCVSLHHPNNAPQVLESLLLVMVDLGPWVARRLAARGVPHLMQLVESLGELGSGQQQVGW